MNAARKQPTKTLIDLVAGDAVTITTFDVMGKRVRAEKTTVKRVQKLKDGLKITTETGDSFNDRGRERIKPGTFSWAKTTKQLSR